VAVLLNLVTSLSISPSGQCKMADTSIFQTKSSVFCSRIYIYIINFHRYAWSEISNCLGRSSSVVK